MARRGGRADQYRSPRARPARRRAPSAAFHPMRVRRTHVVRPVVVYIALDAGVEPRGGLWRREPGEELRGGPRPLLPVDLCARGRGEGGASARRRRPARPGHSPHTRGGECGRAGARPRGPRARADRKRARATTHLLQRGRKLRGGHRAPIHPGASRRRPGARASSFPRASSADGPPLQGRGRRARARERAGKRTGGREVRGRGKKREPESERASERGSEREERGRERLTAPPRYSFIAESGVGGENKAKLFEEKRSRARSMPEPASRCCYCRPRART